MTPLDFDYLRAFLKERSGLTLSPEKQYLVESRLQPVARKAELKDIGELVQRLRQRREDALASVVVEAMTTNETSFFRDKLPFEHFRSLIMPELLAARGHRKHIRIWCAAAAAGQEPYSLAMILKEMGCQLGDVRVDILATDLSTEILEKARMGIYSQFEVQRGLPIQMLVKYFSKLGEMWQIAPEIRSMVQFRPFNLMRNFASLGTFDLVFCRNVLIYFDQPTKIDVLDRLAGAVAHDGYLCLGAAETVIGLTSSFKAIPERRGLYAPNRSAPVANVVAFPRAATA